MASKTKRRGNQKPTVMSVRPFKKSLYRDALSIYQRTGRKEQAWQANILRPLMAVQSGGLWVHTKFGYSLPRRNGKNEVVVMREMWGLLQGEQILHTAHRTTTSHSAWLRLMDLLDKAEIEYKSLRGVGRESVEIESTGGKAEFRTRSSKGGLGEGFDLLVIDEAQEYTSDHETALKYVVTDSRNPQTIFCGTPPTPLSAGTVFPDLRKVALEGGAETTGWAEWSVEEQSNIHDRELWYLTNPSLGLIFTERSVSDEIGSDEIDFNIQRLGLWIRYNQKSAISKTDWENLQVEKLPTLVGNMFVGVKYGGKGVNVALSVAVKTDDGRVFVEAVDCRSVRQGNQWILDFLRKAEPQAVIVDGAGAQNLLAAEMSSLRLRPPVLPTVREVVVANAAFEQAIFTGGLLHRGQPSLHLVATNCEKRPIGTNGGFGYKSQMDDLDIALLDSTLLAYWICSESKPPVKQRVNY